MVLLSLLSNELMQLKHIHTLRQIIYTHRIYYDGAPAYNDSNACKEPSFYKMQIMVDDSYAR